MRPPRGRTRARASRAARAPRRPRAPAVTSSPAAQDDVAEFIAAHKTSVETVIEALQTMYSKYKLMETGLTENRKALRAKIPDIAASLDVVRMLQARAAADGPDTAFSTYFALSDQVHAKASIAPKGTVCLWLGANIMLEYTYDEARALLESNLQNATQKVADTTEELDILREQTIITEVRARRARGGFARRAARRGAAQRRLRPSPPPNALVSLR